MHGHRPVPRSVARSGRDLSCRATTRRLRLPCNQPSQIPEAMPDAAQPSDPAASAQPSDPAAPIPGNSSQVTPAPMQPGDTAAPPPQSSQAPLSIEPAAPKAADASGSAQFLTKQASDDWLASNLIGQSVYNAKDENDRRHQRSRHRRRRQDRRRADRQPAASSASARRTWPSRFEDLKLARDENNSIKVIADLSQGDARFGARLRDAVGADRSPSARTRAIARMPAAKRLTKVAPL